MNFRSLAVTLQLLACVTAVVVGVLYTLGGLLGDLFAPLGGHPATIGAAVRAGGTVAVTAALVGLGLAFGLSLSGEDRRAPLMVAEVAALVGVLALGSSLAGHPGLAHPGLLRLAWLAFVGLAVAVLVHSAWRRA